jgi:hypothetical protein
MLHQRFGLLAATTMLLAALPLHLPSRGLTQPPEPNRQPKSSLQPFETTLVETLQEEPKPAERREAARKLGLRGSMAAVRYLARSAAYDPDRQTRIAAGDAIALIRRRVPDSWVPRPPRPPTYEALISSWYQLYLDRAPDEPGMKDFLNRMQQGTSPEAIQAAMMGSEEYFTLHGSRKRAWVAGLYADVLDRSPEPDEINVWLQTLERLGGARDQTAEEFLRGAKDELNRRKQP